MDMHSSHGGPDGSSCKISMLWNWYTIDACFLSPNWHITTQGMFAATCIGVVLLVMLVEFFRRLGKEYDAFLLRQFQRQLARQYADGASFASSQVIAFRATVLQQLTRSVLHALTFGSAYIVMLLAMYFNGYVIICIFIGAGLGKFVCDWLEVRMHVDGGREDKQVRGVEEPSVCCG